MTEEEILENCLLLEQSKTIDQMRERIMEMERKLEEKDKVEKDLRDKVEKLEVERDTWVDRYKKMKDLKNEVRTDKFVHKKLDEVDLKVHRTGMYGALKWDFMENQPGKRVNVLTPQDKTLFLKLEGEFAESDNCPIVEIFKHVVNKLKGVTIVFDEN